MIKANRKGIVLTSDLSVRWDWVFLTKLLPLSTFVIIVRVGAILTEDGQQHYGFR